MEEKKDVELKSEGALARVSGGSKESQMPAGFEGLEEGDIKMARLGIAQGLSQVCIDGKAKMGQLFNNITQEVFGDSIEIIPLFMFKTRAQFDTEQGLVMLSRDNIKVTMAIGDYAKYLDKPVEEVPGAEWEGEEPPKFAVVYNFPVLLAGKGAQFPLSLSLMKTATKVAKVFLSMARYSGEDMFARVYKLSSKMEKSPKGTFALPVIEFSRRCTDAEYASAKLIFDKLYRLKSSIDVELSEEQEQK
jgi:hypothetical protein